MHGGVGCDVEGGGAWELVAGGVTRVCDRQGRGTARWCSSVYKGVRGAADTRACGLLWRPTGTTRAYDFCMQVGSMTSVETDLRSL